jgi:hypothetical protein
MTLCLSTARPEGSASGTVVDRERVRTVGELLAVLRQFPPELPIMIGLDPAAVVYRLNSGGNAQSAAMSVVCIDGDPFEDDF